MKRTLAIALVFCSVLISIAAHPVASTGQSIFRRPEDAAQALYRAWRKRDRARAEYVSNNEVVDKLFGVRRRVMIFKGCHKREEGDYECLYEDRKNDITLAMLTHVRRRGYIIRSISFSSEAE